MSTPRTLVVLSAICVLAGCGAQDTPKKGDTAAPTQTQQNAITRANAYRAQVQLPALNLNQALDVAATKHAGWQALHFGAGTLMLSHYESSDANATSGAPADTVANNPLFVAKDFGDRIRAANGGADIFSGSYVYYEGISSVIATGGIDSLWDTVYHRLPLCRRESSQFGYGDIEGARILYPAANVPNYISNGFTTTEYAGNDFTVVTTFWPPTGTTNVNAAFITDDESPDPLSSTNTLQHPPTPDVVTCGEPLHYLVPTSHVWTSVTVSLMVQGTSTNLPVYVLAGYLPNALPGSLPSGITTFDDDLNVGELFILPQAALASNTTYVWSVTATTNAPETFTLPAQTFTTAP
jgi:hypothetical protein